MGSRRCAFCGGGLGLVAHSHWSLRFCSLAHKKAYLHRRDQAAKLAAEQRRWHDFLFKRQ